MQESEGVSSTKYSDLDLKLKKEIENYGEMKKRPDGKYEFKVIYDIYKIIGRHTHYV